MEMERHATASSTSFGWKALLEAVLEEGAQSEAGAGELKGGTGRALQAMLRLRLGGKAGAEPGSLRIQE